MTCVAHELIPLSPEPLERATSFDGLSKTYIAAYIAVYTAKYRSILPLFVLQTGTTPCDRHGEIGPCSNCSSSHTKRGYDARIRSRLL